MKIRHSAEHSSCGAACKAGLPRPALASALVRDSADHAPPERVDVLTVVLHGLSTTKLCRIRQALAMLMCVR